MKKRLVQINSFLTKADGISGIIQAIHERSAERGFDSRICVLEASDPLREYEDASLGRLMGYFDEAVSIPTAFVYHYGYSDPRLDEFLACRDLPRKVFYYHNVTPPRFFRGWNRGQYKKLLRTEESLARLFATSWLVTGDSRFNIECLPLTERQTVLPPVFPASQTSGRLALQGKLKPRDPGARPVLLFVGRFAPNKRQDVLLYLVRDLASLGVDCDLILAGKGEGSYLEYLRALARGLRIQDQVSFELDVADSKLVNVLYRKADYVVIASEHEGFCLPLLEALAQGLVPIARPFGALKELLAGSWTLTPDETYLAFFDRMREAIAVTANDPRAYRALLGEARACFAKNTRGYLSIDGFIDRVLVDSDRPATHESLADWKASGVEAWEAVQPRSSFLPRSSRTGRRSVLHAAFAAIDASRARVVEPILGSALHPYLKRLYQGGKGAT